MWSTFARNFVSKNFQKSPNLVTLFATVSHGTVNGANDLSTFTMPVLDCLPAKRQCTV